MMPQYVEIEMVSPIQICPKSSQTSSFYYNVYYIRLCSTQTLEVQIWPIARQFH